MPEAPLAICLTSIPARFALLARQTARLRRDFPGARILVTLPRVYRRFPGEVPRPELAPGVERLDAPRDFGPLCKVYPARVLPQTCDLIWCDDDCHYLPGWAEALRASRQHPDDAVASSGFAVTRLLKDAPAPAAQTLDIVQGFGGVLLRAGLLPPDAMEAPDLAFGVDDVWLSGLLARDGITCRMSRAARMRVAPMPGAPEPLQDAVIAGMRRDQANKATARFLRETFGIWPPAGPRRTGG